MTRDQAVDVFVTFVRANPQYLQEPPMEVVFRAVSANWPCPKYTGTDQPEEWERCKRARRWISRD